MSPRAFINRVVNAVKNPEAEVGRLERTIRGVIAVSRVSRKQLRHDRATMMAAALTYRTIFSLVPLLVLSLVVVKAFLGQEAIRGALTRFMEYTGLSELETTGSVNGGESARTNRDSIGEWIERFVNNASSFIEDINYGAITIAGIALFIYAALSLFMMVEQSFNTVYRARESRDLFKRFLSYWGLLTLGLFPLMMSIGFIEWLKQTAQELPSWLAWVSWGVSHVASAALTWLIFTAIYKAVPNTRVHLKPALFGAGIAAILWEIAKAGLSAFVGAVMSRQAAIYGSLAMIPIFMLWVYITWIIILFGLQAARIMQSIGSEGALRLAAEMDEQPVLVSPASAIVLMKDLGQRYKEGKATDTEGAAERCDLPEYVVSRMCEALVRAGLVRAVAMDEDDVETYVPAKPVESISAQEVYTAVERLYQSPRAVEEERRLRGALGEARIEPGGGSETEATA